MILSSFLYIVFKTLKNKIRYCHKSYFTLCCDSNCFFNTEEAVKNGQCRNIGYKRRRKTKQKTQHNTKGTIRKQTQ